MSSHPSDHFVPDSYQEKSDFRLAYRGGIHQSMCHAKNWGFGVSKVRKWDFFAVRLLELWMRGVTG